MTPADATRDELTPGHPLARALSVAIALLMIASSLFILSTGASAASILEVDDNAAPSWYTVGHYHNITDAVTAAVNGDTILVHGGTYDEAVTVGKEVVIQGDDNDDSAKIVQKPGSNVLAITANNVKIIGLTIKDGESGVAINGVNNFQVIGCDLIGNKNGVYVNGGYTGLLANNSVNNNTNVGIYVYQGFGMELENNSVQGNGKEGVLLMDSGSVTMQHNNMTGNLYDLSVVGSSPNNYDLEIADSNTVSGRKVYYLNHEIGKTVPTDAGYVGIYLCSDITVQNLTISKVGQGVLIAGSSNVKVKGLVIQDCQVGMEVRESNDSQVDLCLVNGSIDYGIRINGGNGNQIGNSTIIGTKSLTFGNNIYASSSTRDTIADCILRGSTGIGVQFVDSNECKVVRTTISNTKAAALSLMRSADCVIDNNSVINNLDGIVVGVEGTSSGRATVSGNLVDNAPGPGNGITLIDYPSTKVVNNRLIGNDIGIDVSGSPTSSSKNTGMVIQNNVIEDNVHEGISISNYITEAQISGNVISVEGGSYYGIRLGDQTTKSLVYDNSITGVRNAYDGGSQNRWNISKTTGTNVLGGPYQGGNYYSNNTDAVDVNQDGICDSTYNPTGVSKVDSLPLFNVARPSEPVGFVAVAGDSRIVLGWSAPSSNGGWAITGYKLYRGTAPGNVAFYRNLGDVTTYSDLNVTNGNFTYYEIAALNDVREGTHNAAWTTPIDNVIPKIISTDLNGTGAPITSNLTIIFSEVMKNVSASINDQKMVVTLDGAEAQCLIPFVVELDTTYYVSVNGSDLAGNEMTGFFDYTTTDLVMVMGRVVDSDNRTVANALVNIGGTVTTTDPEGNFTLYIRPGTYPIIIEADGLDPYIGNATVSSTGNDLGVFLTAGSQNKGDDTNWLLLLGGLGGLIAGIVLLAFVLRMRKQQKKEGEDPPSQ